MLAVMVVYLHRKRHIRVCGEIRRAHRRKLRQFWNVLVRRVPISNELIIVHKEMNDFTFRVFRGVMVIHGDKLACGIHLDWLNLRNIVLANAGECELVKIFKVNHKSPSKQKCRKIHFCTLRHSKRPDSNRSPRSHGVITLYDYLLCLLYQTFFTNATSFFSSAVNALVPPSS